MKNVKLKVESVRRLATVLIGALCAAYTLCAAPVLCAAVLGGASAQTVTYDETGDISPAEAKAVISNACSAVASAGRTSPKAAPRS